jgi:hypothetical protein
LDDAIEVRIEKFIGQNFVVQIPLPASQNFGPRLSKLVLAVVQNICAVPNIWAGPNPCLRRHHATTKDGLKRELKRVWREEITKEVCQKCIRLYFMLGGTLGRCIAALMDSVLAVAPPGLRAG